MKKFTQVIGILVVGFVGALTLVLLRGYVLSELWGWFIEPLGAPAISVAHAIGISGVFALLMMGFATEKPTKDEDDGPWVKVFAAFAKGLFYCLFGWGMGAVVHGFM